MVKLAEPKQKNRYTLVPRGKPLYEDDTRFGTKMLEKMGWTKGKGLGANEDGAKEFVRVKYKNDAQGFGYEDRDDQWTQHEESFNGLLESLNGSGSNTAEEKAESESEMGAVGFGFKQNAKKTKEETSLKAKISGESLEEKSKRSRARVHYKKFTRGKDLAQYSEKDLANIFGKKALDEVAATPKAGDEETVEEKFQCSSMSVTDYFKQKMEALKKQRGQKQEGTSDKVEVKEDEGEKECSNEKTSGKKKKKKSKKVESEDQHNCEDSQIQEEPKEKKRKKCEQLEITAKEIKCDIPEKDDESTNVNEGGKKKKKKSKKRENEDKKGCEESQNDDEPKKKRKMSEQVEAETREKADDSAKENANENSGEKKKKKKSKRVDHEDQSGCKERKNDEELKKNKSTNCQQVEIITEKNLENTVGELNSKIRKKKTSKMNTNVSEVEAEIMEAKTEAQIEAMESHANVNKSPEIIETEKAKELKKKKKKNHNKETADPLPEENVSNSKENIKNSDENVNNSKDTVEKKSDPKPPESLEEIKKKLERLKVRTISKYVAEQFKYLDMSGFEGSNLPFIHGYGTTPDTRIEVVSDEEDEKRLQDLWSCTVSKYDYKVDNDNKYRQYKKEVEVAKKTKQKPPRFKVNQYRKKGAFKNVV